MNMLVSMIYSITICDMIDIDVVTLHACTGRLHPVGNLLTVSYRPLGITATAVPATYVPYVQATAVAVCLDRLSCMQYARLQYM